MDSFENKVAVVTGGGTGMGRALTLALVSQGCEVAICDVSEDNMQETASWRKLLAVVRSARSCAMSQVKPR